MSFWFCALLLATSACGHVAPGGADRPSGGGYSGGGPTSSGTSTGPSKPVFDVYEQCESGSKDCMSGTRVKQHP